MDLDEEKMTKDSASRYHRLLAAVNTKGDGTKGESQGEKACREALHKGIKEYDLLVDELKRWFELEEALHQNANRS